VAQVLSIRTAARSIQIAEKIRSGLLRKINVLYENPSSGKIFGHHPSAHTLPAPGCGLVGLLMCLSSPVTAL